MPWRRRKKIAFNSKNQQHIDLRSQIVFPLSFSLLYCNVNISHQWFFMVNQQQTFILFSFFLSSNDVRRVMRKRFYFVEHESLEKFIINPQDFYISQFGLFVSQMSNNLLKLMKIQSRVPDQLLCSPWFLYSVKAQSLHTQREQKKSSFFPFSRESIWICGKILSCENTEEQESIKITVIKLNQPKI